MFVITGHKGFQMTFVNGYTVSVQWGVGNYCSRYGVGASGKDLLKEALRCEKEDWKSATAECAVINPKGEFHRMRGWTDDIKGHMGANDVASLIAKVSKL